MSTAKFALLFLSFILFAARASGSSTPVQCAEFSWASHSAGAERAAMLVHAQLNDQPLRLQLDTGSDISALYRLGGDTGTATVSGSLRLGPLDLGEQHFVTFDDIAAGVAEGVIGLDALLGHQLLIDYPARTLCLKASTPAGEWLEIPSRLKRGKLFLFSQVGEQPEWGYFFDTGASLYHLLVDKSRWQELTGRTGDEPDNRILRGSGWGNTLTTVGTPLPTPLRLGPLLTGEPLVHFVMEQPARFSGHPARAKGLIGNAPFMDRVVRIDLRGNSPLFAVRQD